jgi:hypothetical protein
VPAYPSDDVASAVPTVQQPLLSGASLQRRPPSRLLTPALHIQSFDLGAAGGHIQHHRPFCKQSRITTELLLQLTATWHRYYSVLERRRHSSILNGLSALPCLSWHKYTHLMLSGQ